MTDGPLFGNRDDLIASLCRSLRTEHAPQQLKQALETEAWRDFHTPLRDHVTHERFKDFVTAEPFYGLGSTMDVVRALAKSDQELQQLLREAVPEARKHGANRHSRESTTHSTKARDAAAVVARLKRDDSELAAQVVNGDVSPNAAARLKGWRKPRIVVSNPESVATRLREHFTADEVAELRRLLE